MKNRGKAVERSYIMSEKVITVAIAGLGSRGFHTYAQCEKMFPEKMKIVAIADIKPDRVQMTVDEFHIPAEGCYTSAEEMFAEERLADVAFICTQDRQHVPHALMALRKGYHLLLEKPISPELEDCQEILRVAKEMNRTVLVCHVLRYTPFYGKIKELIQSGVVGDIVSVHHIEDVIYWHQAHSFVRGNWRREDETSPMLLAKCCHDLDLLLWLTGKHCKKVTSFGGLHLFKPEKAPVGAAKRCMDGCLAKANCPYDAEKIYITNQVTGVAHGNTGWPCDVLADVPTEESIREAILTGPYGRCVYACDNNVVDHQSLNMEMEDGSTIAMTMTAFTDRGGRDTKICGTHGEIIARLADNQIIVRPYKTENSAEPQIIDVGKLDEDLHGHAGGDHRLVEELLDILRGKEPGIRTTSLDVSVESHLVAFAAERSRLEGGRPVALSEFVSDR